MKFIRIFLFILIIIGIGLLLTQKTWVPKVVDYIISQEQPNEVIVARPGRVDTGVEGIVTIGGQPQQTALVIRSGTKEIIVRTDAGGYFSQDLVPGNYTIGEGANSMSNVLRPISFKVELHKLVSLNLEFNK